MLSLIAIVANPEAVKSKFAFSQISAGSDKLVIVGQIGQRQDKATGVPNKQSLYSVTEGKGIAGVPAKVISKVVEILAFCIPVPVCSQTTTAIPVASEGSLGS